jgi:hypothetical protein
MCLGLALLVVLWFGEPTCELATDCCSCVAARVRMNLNTPNGSWMKAHGVCEPQGAVCGGGDGDGSMVVAVLVAGRSCVESRWCCC